MRWLPALAAAALSATAQAHDTWFERLPAAPGQVQLALGTGNQFPVHESGIGAEFLVEQGCRIGGAASAAAATQALQPVRDADTALILRAPAGASACWAETAPFDVELAPDKIALYLREINASAELRATWAAMQSRGLKWKERFTKHARINLTGASAAALAAPVPMALDVLLSSSGPQLRRGDTLTFRVLRHGQPLAGFALEMRGEASRFGVWRRTDAEGRVTLPAPPAGRWMVRGTELYVSPKTADEWESRFVTLAFEVLPAN